MAFDDYTFSLSKFASQPNQGSIAGAQFSKRKQLPKLFFTSRFSLSEKLHLETAFNTTLFLARSFAAAETIPDLAYTFGKYGHRSGTLL
jgi:iron complex outermembrane receptor protein